MSEESPFHGAAFLRVPGETKTLTLMRRRAAVVPRVPTGVPSGHCRICDRAATQFTGSVAFCDRHVADVNQLVNAGRTDGVRAILEAHHPRGVPDISLMRSVGSLRAKLKARRMNEQENGR